MPEGDETVDDEDDVTECSQLGADGLILFLVLFVNEKDGKRNWMLMRWWRERHSRESSPLLYSSRCSSALALSGPQNPQIKRTLKGPAFPV